MSLEFTSSQKSLIESESGGFFEACPGAGKTQTIVERFARRADSEDSRCGTALVTFTNAAAEEVQRRCAHKPKLLQAPNFVGTIDSFINRFFVTPFYKAEYGKAPKFWDSWSSFDSADVVIKGRCPVPLDHFQFDNDRAKLRKRHIQGYSQSQICELESQAYTKWTQFVRSGHLDADTARLLARTEIEENKYGIVELLAKRFEEVIVDEVQDCNSVDLLVLKSLRDAGIRLISVGDLDQSIYEFRGTSAPEVSNFLQSTDPQPRIDTNFRSSPAICKVVNSLRAGSTRDTSGGEVSTYDAPVHLIGYQHLSEIGPLVERVIDQYPELEKPVFLAHSTNNAALAAGGRSKGKSSKNKIVALAKASSLLLDSSSTSAKRTKALRETGILLQRLNPDKQLSTAEEEDYLENLRLSKSSYHELCLRLVVTVGNPSEQSSSTYRKKLIQAAEGVGISLDRGRMKTPKADVWPWVGTPAAKHQYEHSTVHGFKGLEANSVVLVIPHDSRTRDTIRDWKEGKGSEARRVLYVGASRAKRLLILAVHKKHREDVKQILERDDVPLAVSG
ncbi:UvrD-helicase domain-containing protein [Corynebacterium segmentosum]|uniref:ATP-dependent helicase n=1 Tax=Corynebacterium TaxID=1716 RepID=UPI0003B9160C|nr:MULTISPECIES: ATP-dependent helicase [Corynebacterium]ERS53282.1 hypothetical protein HMPREF1267_01214 [Corynebacterium sp. KPL1824]MDK4268113.1 ATP-dependent helicase [Corynebacterium accolens]MDK8679044.1 ATP-dependent helicase [Corynebacterium accolens]WKS57716.1 ATP-dependent helicase [Corynebacterium accolens]